MMIQLNLREKRRVITDVDEDEENISVIQFHHEVINRNSITEI